MACVSFDKDVKPLFSARDIQCMSRHRVLLDDYRYMAEPIGDAKFDDHANARHVFARLSGRETPRMPQGGPFWSQTQLDIFRDWMEGDFQP